MSKIIIRTDYRAKNLGNRGRGRIRGIVLHDTAGSGTDGDTRYLASDPEHRGVSVDFTVNRAGVIQQLNPNLADYYTYHAGRNTKFKDSVNAAVNRHTIGIEIIQKARMNLLPIWPREQVEAVAELCVHLCDRFKLTKADITTHSRIITDGSRSDPRDWPWNDFWAYFRGFASQNDQQVGSNTTDLAKRIVHKVREGDTLWALAIQYNTRVEVIKALNGLDTPSNTIVIGQDLVVKE